MAEKAASQGIVFRPHFKTHASLEVGRWYREEGITRITVSSIAMAEYFAADGWNDITIAFPFHAGIADPVNALAEKIRLNIIVSSVASAETAAKLLRFEINVWIETDTGYPRTGIKAEDIVSTDCAVSLLKTNSRIHFQGFLAHFGHSYAAKNRQEVSIIWNEGIGLLNNLKQRYSGSRISVGDTPCCSLVDDFSGADEIRPGNFVYYDLMQLQAGACTSDDVAVAVLCPVVAVYPGEHRIVLHGGAVHLSKESLEVNGIRVFGKVGFLNNNDLPEYPGDCFITSLSQEHAVVSIPPRLLHLFREGGSVAVMPVHSCLSADALRGFFLPLKHQTHNNCR